MTVGPNGERMVSVIEVRRVLSEHWLAGIACDHETRTDAAACACSQWRSPVVETPRAAAHAWIDHVVDQLLGPDAAVAAAPPPPNAGQGQEEGQ